LQAIFTHGLLQPLRTATCAHPQSPNIDLSWTFLQVLMELTPSELHILDGECQQPAQL
jgi:hypothetical protein